MKKNTDKRKRILPFLLLFFFPFFICPGEKYKSVLPGDNLFDGPAGFIDKENVFSDPSPKEEDGSYQFFSRSDRNENEESFNRKKEDKDKVKIIADEERLATGWVDPIGGDERPLPFDFGSFPDPGMILLGLLCAYYIVRRVRKKKHVKKEK
ncbi:MAG: hypothetical protein LUG18_08320 [Candidatus Azobacteroides sp.]|nr:hypothetical protein [Candidatus Azobacteroides sp.]